MFSTDDLDSLHPLQSDDFLPPVSRWTNLGSWLILGTFGTAVILASVIKYNIKVRAIANIRPATEVQIIQARTEGTIKSIEVKEKQAVKPGEAIAYIDDPRLNRLELQQQYLKEYLEQTDTQKAQLAAQLRALDTQILTESGLATNSVLSVQNEANNEERNYRIETALAKLATSRQKRAEQLASQRESLIQELSQTENQIATREEQLQRVTTAIDNSIVRTPTEGKVLKLNVRNSGQTVRPGEVIAEIVPSNTPLVVKARVAAQDIGRIALGQTAQLRVDAYPYPDYGTLRGKVTQIAPDTLPCQGNCLSGATDYYETIIELEKPYLIKGEHQYPIQPGMEVTADIISRRERAITFILRKARLLTDF